MAGGRVQHGEGWLEVAELCHRRLNAHVVGEERVPRALADHAHRQAVRLVGARIDVLHEDVEATHAADEILVCALANVFPDSADHIDTTKTQKTVLRGKSESLLI